ncbi:MAG: potassium transporter, partial [Cytophagales bacterium]|nr:potassium transporter [Cytophagales bacterium]
SWTVVHPITKDSVLYGETPESLQASDGEFLISVKGVNDTMIDPVHSLKSYLYSELIWGAKFDSILNVEGEEYTLDLAQINSYHLV